MHSYMRPSRYMATKTLSAREQKIMAENEARRHEIEQGTRRDPVTTSWRRRPARVRDA